MIATNKVGYSSLILCIFLLELLTSIKLIAQSPEPGSGQSFDPMYLLTKMDTNGNGLLEPVEVHGSTRFLLDRLLQSNSTIDPTRPIPVSVLAEAFRRMRGDGYAKSWNGGLYGDDERIVGDENVNLVPSFSNKRKRMPVAGFGARDGLAIHIGEKELEEAGSLIKRYDKNDDHLLDESELVEIGGSDRPLQYDQNNDGKLSIYELAGRQARQRIANDGKNSTKRDRSIVEKKTVRPAEKKNAPGLFDHRSSYRTMDKDGNPVRQPGIPDWFIKKDVNLDNQVSMPEFIKVLDHAAIDDFYRFDQNHDGFITSGECLRAVRSGMIPGAITDWTGPTSNSISASESTPMQLSGLQANSKLSHRHMDDRTRLWIESKFRKLDRDKNLTLSTDEFMEGDFATTDTSKDGVIDFQEYVALRGK